MRAWKAYVAELIARGATPAPGSGPPHVARYGDVAAEYRVLHSGPAIVARMDRALLEITGKDRAAWLHNLTTNQVKTLGVGEGNYAFVLNVQGRILFDVNLLVRADSIWIDLDRGFLDTARKHFAKYAITEDVTVTDRTDEFIRIALAGEAAKGVLTALGSANAAAMPALGQATIDFRGASVSLIRHDFCGPFAAELFVPANVASEFWTSLVREYRAAPVGEEAVQIRRIEAGIPWPHHEITNEYLPAETRQQERAVSYQKGCYLGQEVVERMRSRQVVARQLVGLQLDSEVACRSALVDLSGKAAGEVTSACYSLALQAPLALGYVKTALASPGDRLAAGGASAIVKELPLAARPAQ